MQNKYADKKSSAERERQREELRTSYREDFRQCKQVFPPINAIEEYLGELDADIEWGNDKDGAIKRFLDTEAYQKFSSDKYIVLIGRTGTGKSSILNRFSYAVKSGEIKKYQTVINIRFEQLFATLTMFHVEHETAIHYLLRDFIDIIVKLFIVQELVRGADGTQESGELSNFLEDRAITDGTDIIGRMCGELHNIHRTNSQMDAAIMEVKNMYSFKEIAPVQKEFLSALKDKNIVVLADSMDYYDVGRKKEIMIVKALVEKAFEYCNSFSENHILMKIAIPSEIYTHVIVGVADKKQNKVIAIEWRYKDIIRMLAIKIFYFFRHSEYEFAYEFLEKYKLTDFYDYNKALDFLHLMLPQNCCASIPLCFETLPYCIRHTQKKPRQIIKIFNSFIDKICSEKDFRFFHRNSDTICDFIHKTQGDIIKDALNMYNNSAGGKILPIVTSVLKNKRNFMTEREFKNALKDGASVFGPEQMNESDVEQILIESGMVGQVYQEGFVERGNDLFQNNHVLKVCIAAFEYQIKDTLSFGRNDIYVLHPMCYEYFANIIDYNALVYPTPADDADDNVIEKINSANSIF